MSNPAIRKLINQQCEAHPDVPRNVIESIWLAGYSCGRKGPVKFTSHKTMSHHKEIVCHESSDAFTKPRIIRLQ